MVKQMIVLRAIAVADVHEILLPHVCWQVCAPGQDAVEAGEDMVESEQLIQTNQQSEVDDRRSDTAVDNLPEF